MICPICHDNINPIFFACIINNISEMGRKREYFIIFTITIFWHFQNALLLIGVLSNTPDVAIPGKDITTYWFNLFQPRIWCTLSLQLRSWQENKRYFQFSFQWRRWEIAACKLVDFIHDYTLGSPVFNCRSYPALLTWLIVFQVFLWVFLHYHFQSTWAWTVEGQTTFSSSFFWTV